MSQHVPGRDASTTGAGLRRLATKRDGIEHHRLQQRARAQLLRPLAHEPRRHHHQRRGVGFADVDLVQQQPRLHGLAHADLVGEQHAPVVSREDRHRRHVLVRHLRHWQPRRPGWPPDR